MGYSLRWRSSERQDSQASVTVTGTGGNMRHPYANTLHAHVLRHVQQCLYISSSIHSLLSFKCLPCIKLYTLISGRAGLVDRGHGPHVAKTSLSNTLFLQALGVSPDRFLFGWRSLPFRITVIYIVPNVLEMCIYMYVYSQSH